jgi:hypothetical protein
MRRNLERHLTLTVGECATLDAINIAVVLVLVTYVGTQGASAT